MAKTVLVVVHGVGHWEEGWAEAPGGPVEELSKAAEYYPGFSADKPLSDAVDFVGIDYDDIFRGVLQRWDDLATSLNGLGLPGVTPKALRAVTDALARAGEPDNFFTSHAMDVAFYVAFPVVRRLVQLRVASRIMTTVAQHAGRQCTYVALGHSLGTTVLHDAIQRISSTGWLSNLDAVLEALNDQQVETQVSRADLQAAVERYGSNPFGPGKFQFEAVFQVSNTSRLLARTKDPYVSVVRPLYSGGALGQACRRFYNADHYLDPISKLRRHRCEEAWPQAAREYTARDLFSIRHVHDVNVHGLCHYIAHPSLHRELLYTLAPARFGWSHYQAAGGRLDEGGDFPTWGPRYLDQNLQDDLVGLLGEFSPESAFGDVLEEYKPRVEQLIGTVEVPSDVLRWLATAVALKAVADDVRGRVAGAA